MKSNDIHFYLGPEGGAAARVYPICSDDVSVSYSEHEEDKFYLPTWKGELVFSKPADLAIITGASLGTKFVGWAEYFDGHDGMTLADFHFTELDGKWDRDNSVFTVEPIVDSPYDKILKHLDDEIDLFQASTAPHIEPVRIFRRPLLQIWIEGTSSIGCWLGTLHWERELEGWENYSIPVYANTADDPNDITNPFRYGFIEADYLSHLCFTVASYGQVSPNCLRLGRTYVGPEFDKTLVRYLNFDVDMNDDNTLNVSSHSSGFLLFLIIDNATSTTRWRGGYNLSDIPVNQVFSVGMDPMNGSTGSLVLNFAPRRVAARLLSDTHPITDSYSRTWGTTLIPEPGNDWQGSGYREIREDDPFIGKTGYKYYLQYAPPEDFVITSGEKTTDPNANGLWQPDVYYKLVNGYRPLAPLGWGDFSTWYPANGMDYLLDVNGTSSYTLKHAYPLWSVLEVLLHEVDPNISFDPTNFSEFFNQRGDPTGVDPLLGELVNVLFTPSSNILAGNYDQPAMKAKITLGRVLDGLKKIYNAYWFIDNEGLFRVEHLAYFEQGGGYTPQTASIFDLTSYVEPKTQKPWAFGLNKYDFNDKGLVGKIVYKWPENASALFVGNPIEFEDLYVDKDQTEERTVDSFMTDIDLMHVSPDDYSKDGFVMLCADWDSKERIFKLPFTGWNSHIDGLYYRLQNGRLSNSFLNYYYRRWGLPSRNILVEGVHTAASSTIKAKEQEVNWPATLSQFIGLPSQLNFLIKTGIGNGKIKEISLFLYSRKIEAKLAQTTTWITL
jgi:hypothetical protein